jgi:hypothetical protein
MMDLDELKDKWTQYDRKLDESIRLSRQLLNMSSLNRAQAAMRRTAALQAVVAALNFIPVFLLGGFIADHIRAPRYMLPAVGLDIFAIGVFATDIRQVAAALLVDYGKPVAVIQRDIENVRILRIRCTQWTLLLAPLAWMPLLVVGMKGLAGLDAYRLLGTTYLMANVAFGVAFVPIVYFLCNWFARRMRPRYIQRIMKDLGGLNLAAATSAIEQLSEFQKEADAP